ncbi:hypothetical protein BDD12DRAFT_226398 [Trichophaea hybrida]|nr:hypothetical protein BDD12DRAFT_226398 [Trichophaea hybrida]
MATLQRPATPAFRAVNAMDIITSSEQPPTRNMTTSRRRSQLTETPPAPPPPPPPPATTTTAAASYDFRPQSSHTTTATPPAIKDEGISSTPPAAAEVVSNGQGENGGDISEKDRSSTEPAEKSGGSAKNSGNRVKKKKGTKFHCTGFGPCNLSFTRSEHLARHIRKHTGERPFMCHCGRWFSRLDNLRQHSSTVHADEEIPQDSLAATGTRYQRHGRPERVRPRSRAQSQSDIQPPTEQEMQSAPPALGSPMVDRRTRRRPSPIVVPPELGQDETAFNQYRDHTPPDSPASTASNFSRLGGSGPYRHRTVYPPVSEVSSPIETPTSSRVGSTLDSPFGSPGYSPRNSLIFDNGNSSIASRRLSMPVPPTPSLLNPNEARALALPMPPSGYGSPTPSTPSRRDSLTSVIADDRRRTWHMGSPVNYLNPLSRDIISPTTQSFARAAIHSPSESNYSPITPSRSQQTDRLPSIHHVLQEFAPATPEQQQVSWASDILERPPTSDLKRPFHEGISGVSVRRVAPGQVRSSHGRSISNIETRRWGGGNHNPFSGPWNDRDRREASLQPHAVTPLSAESNRSSGYFGSGVLSTIPSPREHRQSFGSSDSSVSEGIVTPVAATTEVSRPMILGEPGEAVFHSEVEILRIFIFSG